MGEISLKLNGKVEIRDVADNTLLVDFIREHVGLTGTHVGCDTSQCGACVIHLDGVSVKACTILAKQAEDAGADLVGAEELVDEVASGKIDFDRCISTPDMMPLVGKLGKVLGPRGMRPNPRTGTVTNDVSDAVKSSKSGAVEFRAEKGLSLIHI